MAMSLDVKPEYHYNAPTYQLDRPSDIMFTSYVKMCSVRNIEARGRVSRTNIAIDADDLQTILSECVTNGHSMGFVATERSTTDMSRCIRPVIVDEQLGMFTRVGPMYDGRELTRTQILHDFFYRWIGMSDDAHPREAITKLPQSR